MAESWSGYSGPCLFTLSGVTAVPVLGEEARFPVNRIFCVGRNYAAHAREMGGDPKSEPPFYFSKPASAIVPSGQTIPYALETQDLHHEIELVIALGAPLFRADRESAWKTVYGYAVGLDMTRRDLQAQAKAKGQPWDLAKAFEDSAILSPIRKAHDVGRITTGALSLAVNGQMRQQGDVSDMIWDIPAILCHLSRFYHLQPGDLIYTGTPEGVGPVTPGDVLEGAIESVGTISLTIGAAE